MSADPPPPAPDLPAGWTDRTPVAVRAALLAWFDAHRRDLPWRADRDPYRVWVSEVMLQQTTVAAAGPYFDRFVAAFPTVRDLAAAAEQDVLRLWAGLGYYRRAKHLHAAAKRLAADFPDALPDDPDVWTDLPGVGRYILGAVLSQAFDRKLPVVEANSLRVLARLWGYRGDPRTGPGAKWVWKAAEALLPDARVGDFNQALMELGALICSPADPACGRCPVRGHCQANRLGLQADIPPKPAAKVVTAVDEVAVAIFDADRRVLWCRRPPDAGRWADMWEVPHAERKPGEPTTDAARRIAAELTGLEVEPGPELATVKHAITRYAVTVTCVEGSVVGGEWRSAFYPTAEWLSAAEASARPVSSPQKKVLAAVSAAGRQPRLF